VTDRFGKRAVLRAGYGTVIAVLVLSVVEAYRIQASVSRQHVEIYRHYVDQDAALATLRRNLWLAGNDVRDFFINTTPAQAEILGSQLDALRSDNENALDHLARTSTRSDVVPKLRKSLGEFWAVVQPLPRTMLNESNAVQFEFLQREIVPRRGELYAALLDLAAADQQKLQESEREFADARRHAAERLMIMLGFSLLLSFVVARLSVRHAENLERRAERHYAEVEQTKRELQQLSARLLEIEEEGRRRLSRELHDEIGRPWRSSRSRSRTRRPCWPRSLRPPASVCSAPVSWRNGPCRPFATFPFCCGPHCSTISAWYPPCSFNSRIFCGAAASPANSWSGTSPTGFPIT